MYQVTIKGRNLEELKSAVADIHNELSGGKTVVVGIDKDMSVEEVDTTLKEAMTEASTTDTPTTITPYQTPMEGTTPVEPAPIVDTPIVGSGEGVDAEGLPWDARIHTAKKTKVKEGTWKIKRGTDKALVEQVKTELRTKVNTPAPVVPAAPK